MLRRRLLLGVAAASLGRVALAQRAGDPVSEVYETLPSPVPEDRNKVVEFFAYTCPHCQRLHAALQAWGKTLPAPMRYETIAVPLMGTAAEYETLMFRAGILVAAPAALPAFDQALLDRLAIDGSTLGHHAIARALLDSRISVETVRKGIATRARPIVEDWIRRAGLYQVRATPSIGVGGRFLITPDSTGGRLDLFPTLLNGLVSRIL